LPLLRHLKDRKDSDKAAHCSAWVVLLDSQIGKAGLMRKATDSNRRTYFFRHFFMVAVFREITY
jgi:hypothetical protein